MVALTTRAAAVAGVRQVNCTPRRRSSSSSRRSSRRRGRRRSRRSSSSGRSGRSRSRSNSVVVVAVVLLVVVVDSQFVSGALRCHCLGICFWYSLVPWGHNMPSEPDRVWRRWCEGLVSASYKWMSAIGACDASCCKFRAQTGLFQNSTFWD